MECVIGLMFIDIMSLYEILKWLSVITSTIFDVAPSGEWYYATVDGLYYACFLMLLLLLLHSAHRVDEHGEVAVLHLWRGVRLSHNGKVEVATRLNMTVINKNDSKKAVKNTSLDKGWVAPSLVLLVSPTVQTSVLPEVSKTTTFIGHLYCTFVCIILTLHVTMMMTLIILCMLDVMILSTSIWAKRKTSDLSIFWGYINFNFCNISNFNGPLSRSNGYGITPIDCPEWILWELVDIWNWLILVRLTLIWWRNGS